MESNQIIQPGVPGRHRLLPLAGAVLLACGAIALSDEARALTLGRARAAVLIGQPLDVAVDAQIEAQEDLSTVCVDADVFMGETRLESARVSTVVERPPRAGGPADATVRVRTSSVVDEPLVTVYLRVGCQQKVTRRYVLLSELGPSAAGSGVAPASQVQFRPVAVAPAPVPSVIAPLAQAGTASSDDAATAAPVKPRNSRKGSTPSGGASAGAGETPRGDSVARAGASAKAQAAAGRSQARKDPASAGAGRARLKLDPVDLLVEVSPVLRPSMELETPVAENAQARAAAAAMWRALNAQPADLLRDADQMQALQADVTRLSQSISKSQEEVTGLKRQVEQARAERYSNPLIYTLVALLVLALAAAIWLYTQVRGRVVWRAPSARRDWWRAQERFSELDRDLENDATASATRPSALPKSKVAAQKGGRKSRHDDDDDDDEEIDESLFEDLKRPSAAVQVAHREAVSSHPDFSASLPSMQRSVNAEELMDIQQQADFFISLGQHDQAISVLRTHIHENVETSALAYLDLFKLYHMLGRREDYDALLKDFSRAFSAQVPSFDAFGSKSSKGLEAYGAALSRIESLWPSPRVLDVIEETIFRKPGREEAGAFDIEAYRELLLLYSMAKDLNERPEDLPDFEKLPSDDEPDSVPDSSSHSTRFANTDMQPLPPIAQMSTQHSVNPSVPQQVGAQAAALSESIDEIDLDALMNSVAPDHGDQAHGRQPDPFVPPRSANIGLDIDLSGMGDLDSADGQSATDASGERPLGRKMVNSVPEHEKTQRIRPPATGNESGVSEFDLFDEASRFENSRLMKR